MRLIFIILCFLFLSCEGLDKNSGSNLSPTSIDEMDYLVKRIHISYNFNDQDEDTMYSNIYPDSLQFLIPEMPECDSSKYIMIKRSSIFGNSSLLKEIIIRPKNPGLLWKEITYKYDTSDALIEEKILKVYRGLAMNDFSTLKKVIYSYDKQRRLVNKQLLNFADSTNPVLLEEDIFYYENTTNKYKAH